MTIRPRAPVQVLHPDDLELPEPTPGLYCVADHDAERAAGTLGALLAADLAPAPPIAGTVLEATAPFAIAATSLAGGHVARAEGRRPQTGDTVRAVFVGELVAPDPGGRSPAELLLARYLADERDLARDLDGIFHFAIADPVRRTLLVGTDPWGLRPLFFAANGSSLAIAPSARAALAYLPERALDPDALDLFLVFNFVPGERTLFAGVHEVPPGGTLGWVDGRCETRRHRDLAFPASPRSRPEADEVVELGLHLEAAVAACIHRGGKVALPLSGGFDSRTLLAFAPPDGGPLPLFTYGAPGSDDLAVVARLSPLVAGPWHVFHLDPGYLGAWAPEVVRSTSGLHNALNAHGLALRSVRRFADVALLGNGGDALLDYHYECAPDATRAEAKAFLLAHTNHGVPWDALASLLPPARLLRARELARQVVAETAARVDSDRGLDVTTYFDLRERQRRFVNVGIRTQSAHIGFREPYYTRPVVEFALGLPPALRRNRRLMRLALHRRHAQLAGVPRQGTRQSALPTFAQRVRWRVDRGWRRWEERGRTALGLTLRADHRGFADYAWDLRHHSRATLESTLLSSRHLGRWVESRGVERLVAAHFRHRANNATALGVLLTLELAMRLFLEDEKPPASTP